jgi:hypothetical protein
MSPDDFDPQTDTIVDELSRFDADFRPDPGIRPNLDSLADGDYDMVVEHADLTHTPQNKELILRLALQVVGQPCPVEYAYFFRTQRSANRLGWDLQMLGFDCDRWRTDGRRFSLELRAAVPRLTGRRFRARKTSRKDATGKDWTDLTIQAPRPGQAMPASPSVRVPAAPSPSANGPAAATAPAAVEDDDAIPF